MDELQDFTFAGVSDQPEATPGGVVVPRKDEAVGAEVFRGIPQSPEFATDEERAAEKLAENDMPFDRSLGMQAAEMYAFILACKAEGVTDPEKRFVLHAMGKSARRPETPKMLAPGFLEAALTTVAGAPGQGKSTLVWTLARHITRGEPFPWALDVPVRSGSVVAIMGEDMTDLCKMRARAAGARVGEPLAACSVTAIGSDHPGLEDFPDGLFNVGDVRHLEQIRRMCPDVRLLWIDPIKSFTGPTIKSEDEEARVRRFGRVANAWAASHGICVVMVIHTSKGAATKKVDEQASGSHAWSAVTRSNTLLERNVAYGTEVACWVPGRSNNIDTPNVIIFDREIVPATDEDGRTVPDESGSDFMVPRLVFKSVIPKMEYRPPKPDRAAPESDGTKLTREQVSAMIVAELTESREPMRATELVDRLKSAGAKTWMILEERARLADAKRIVMSLLGRQVFWQLSFKPPGAENPPESPET